MPHTELDFVRMQEALALARGSFGLTEPNPRVGCVIGDQAGRVFGRGATQEWGGPHAEIVALQEAGDANIAGATAWVTLEPCSHHGRTPPCCDALIRAGIARCVVALEDPFPDVAGNGLARMRAAGIQVEFTAFEELRSEALEINIGFISRVVRGRPWVRMKLAASLDGRSALQNGRSQWITGPQARSDGHSWRRRASAVLTGIGTVLADNPRLDVRAVPTAKQPLRVILDSRLQTPSNAALLQPPGGVLVVGSAGTNEQALRLKACGAEVWADGPEGGAPDLHDLMRRLAHRGINEVHVEAGARLNGAILRAGLVDELLLYVAPALLGPGLPMLDLPGLDRLEDALRFRWHSVDRVGEDLRLRLRQEGVCWVDPL